MFAQRPKPQAPISRALDDQFAAEILKSDKLRVTILIGVVTTALLVVLGLAILGYSQFQRSFHGNFKGFLLIIFTVAGLNLILLETERRIINHLIRINGRLSEPMQYFSAFVETSIPTLGMIIGSLFLGPVYTLFTPATLLYPIFIVMSALRLNSRLCVFTGAVAGLEYTALSLFLITKAPTGPIEPILTGVPHHVFKGFLLFATGVVAGLVARQVKQRIVSSFRIIEERNRISRTFGEYVSPAVMNKLLTLKPDLRSEKKQVCVMFLDIRNFTAFSEKRTPEEVFDYLESLFEFMIEIVNRHHGIVNKFLGDGFMAVFGAPLSDGDDCQHGIAAAQEILKRVNEEVASGKVLPTTVGIGLHAGEAVTGSIGSSLRKEYTVIGDVVNLASRIEQLNKEFGSQLLISETVWNATLDGGINGGIPMRQVQVKGRESPIQIYQMA